MTPADLEPVLLLMRKHRVLKLKLDGCDVELHPIAFAPEPQASAGPGKVGAEHGNPTDEEMMFWSSIPVTEPERADS